MFSFAKNIYSGDVVSKDVLNSFRNLLQSGDGTSAKKLVEDLDILWASKGGNADILFFVTSSRAVPNVQKASEGKDDHCTPLKGEKRTAKCAEMDGEGNIQSKSRQLNASFYPNGKTNFHGWSTTRRRM